ncbi:hypothetical protein EJP67_30010 [Variovorax guangxiensis]|uniref:Uncharacterized protein n=1 Tax=Variovorax guangxiensis TaxID=1775474 RepID=A0A3S0ZSN8_9BURK|nr:hypothetical protein [Variovorax guangxiensis]RUR71288.1 hypothetical protein EJP67_30010 [Variovorax guangxiensis]
MNLHPTRHGSLLSNSTTNTADAYGLGRYNPMTEEAGDPPQHQIARLLTLKSQQKLALLRNLEEDWDGNGSAKPIAEAIANAEARLPELYRVSARVGIWREPQVSASEDGEVIFEWWSDERKVTLYFAPESMEVVRSWGTNIDTEMDQSSLPSLDAFADVWIWLQYA